MRERERDRENKKERQKRPLGWARRIMLTSSGLSLDHVYSETHPFDLLSQLNRTVRPRHSSLHLPELSPFLPNFPASRPERNRNAAWRRCAARLESPRTPAVSPFACRAETPAGAHRHHLSRARREKMR
jgi:hypothetical protein